MVIITNRQFRAMGGGLGEMGGVKKGAKKLAKTAGKAAAGAAGGVIATAAGQWLAKFAPPSAELPPSKRAAAFMPWMLGGVAAIAIGFVVLGRKRAA